MPLLTMDEARDHLAPTVERLLVEPRKAAVKQWFDYEALDPGRALALSTTTRAGIIHDHTIREVRAALQSPDLRTSAKEIDDLGFFAVAVGDQLLLRYKYVGGGLPRNVATAKQRRLAKQQYDDETMDILALEGMGSPPTLITCGYTLEPGGLATISVECDFLKRIMWKYVVWGDVGEGFGVYEQLPLDPNLAPEATVVRSARADKPVADTGSE